MYILKMAVTFTLLCTILYVISIRLRRVHGDERGYKCFLLTLPSSKKRQDTFMKHHDETVPIEVIYGEDTKQVDNAAKFKHFIKPEYYKEALKMHYNPSHKRPNITYINMGAIGCYMGHMEFYDRCFSQGLKYAVMFEDNVIVKTPELYKQIQDVIDTMGDNFEICFFHCLSRLPYGQEKGLERVKWITSMKCYLINVENMKEYYKYFFPIDNHVDLKHEDLIAKGARIFYKDLQAYMKIDRTGPSTIGHHDWGDKNHFSRQYPHLTTEVLKGGY